MQSHCQPDITEVKLDVGLHRLELTSSNRRSTSCAASMTMSLSETLADAVGKLLASLMRVAKISCSTTSAWAARNEPSSDNPSTSGIWFRAVRRPPFASVVEIATCKRVCCRRGNPIDLVSVPSEGI